MSIFLKEQKVIKKLLKTGILVQGDSIPQSPHKTSGTKVLLCFPFEIIPFKVAKKIFFPFIMEHQKSVKAVIYQAFIPIIKELNVSHFYSFKNSDIDKTLLPIEIFMKEILSDNYISAADLNTEFNLATAYLTYKTGAKQRIGFSSRLSKYFFNTEINKRNTDFIEIGYLYIKQLILTALEQSRLSIS